MQLLVLQSLSLTRCRIAAGLIVALACLSSPASATQSSAYRSIIVTEGAVLTGEVTFSGSVPEAKRLLITKDAEVCGEGYRERHEVVVAEGGGLLNVVIFLVDVEQGKQWIEPDEGYILDQRNCSFQPHLQIVRPGSDLNIVNSDPVLHNIHSYELIGRARRTLFNFGQPSEKKMITRPLRPRRGSQIQLKCDAHDFMEGWILAPQNPYFAIVNKDGTFEIDDVPAGTYTVKAWHPYLGVQEGQVTLDPSGKGEISFQFTKK